MKKTISFIVPCFNEEQNIKNFIYQILNLNINNYFKEIIIVDNNSNDNSKQLIQDITKKYPMVKYLFQKKIGYGFALQKGLNFANGDLLVTVEPDNTFFINDLKKFLSYIDEFDCVFGTRTSKSLIKHSAKMGSFLRYGNIFVAKIMEYLFLGPSLTDVGCTFKMFKRNSYNKIKYKIKINDSAFQVDLMIRFIQSKCSIVEIPVFYCERVGYSKITYNFNSSFKLGLRMIYLIFKFRFF
jgi:glycosyltransferase involved in cell wall biosynthesis